MLRFLLHYLSYYYKARNAHSLHSPFVYHFYQSVLKKKPLYKRYFSRSEDLLLRTLAFLEVRQCAYYANSGAMLKQKMTPGIAMIEATPSHQNLVLYIEIDSDMQWSDILHLFPFYAVIILGNSYKNESILNFLQQEASYTLTINAYWVGFAFRRAQQKQHFIIKTPLF